MIRNSIYLILILCLTLCSQQSFAQSLSELKPQIENILKKYKAKVGVAIHNQDYNDSLIFNGDHHFPFQSTYKFHLGIAVLDQVDKGKLKLDQVVEISKAKVTTELYSPIKDKYPNGAKLPLSDILYYTIAESDNVGCDILFELLGGTEVVDKYFKDLGYKNFDIKLTEEVQQANWDRQFENWTTVGASNQVLHDYYVNKENRLSPESYKFLWDTMRATTTGQDRIINLLPKGTIVAHKTGTSGRNRKTGEIAATHDIGVVILPNSNVFYISVLVSGSWEGDVNSAKIIAEVAKAAWDFYTSK